MSLENDYDIEQGLEKVLADKKHRELMSALKMLINFLSKDNGVSEIVSKNNIAIDAFLQKIQQLQKQELPDIKIENKEVTKEIKDLSELSKKIIEGQNTLIVILKNKPIKLKVNRDHGIINSIDIDYGLITYKK